MLKKMVQFGAVGEGWKMKIKVGGWKAVLNLMMERASALMRLHNHGTSTNGSPAEALVLNYYSLFQI